MFMVSFIVPQSYSSSSRLLCKYRAQPEVGKVSSDVIPHINNTTYRAKDNTLYLIYIYLRKEETSLSISEDEWAINEDINTIW